MSSIISPPAVQVSVTQNGNVPRAGDYGQGKRTGCVSILTGTGAKCDINQPRKGAFGPQDELQAQQDSDGDDATNPAPIHGEGTHSRGWRQENHRCDAWGLTQWAGLDDKGRLSPRGGSTVTLDAAVTQGMATGQRMLRAAQEATQTRTVAVETFENRPPFDQVLHMER